MPSISATVIAASAAVAGGGVGVGVSIGLSFATNLIGWELENLTVITRRQARRILLPRTRQ